MTIVDSGTIASDVFLNNAVFDGIVKLLKQYFVVSLRYSKG